MGEPRETFRPGPGSVEVRFVRGNDGLAPIPHAVAEAGLTRRFAVVQETCVPGCDDMYFDEALWLALAAFAGRGADSLTAFEADPRPAETPFAEVMETWARTPAEDRVPAWALYARSGGVVALAMVTEFWTAVGGPRLYHDSYTYSFYAPRDVGDEVMTWLTAAGLKQLRFGDLTEIPAHQARSPKTVPGPLKRWLQRLLRR